jgi:hypothetical protein
VIVGKISAAGNTLQYFYYIQFHFVFSDRALLAAKNALIDVYRSPSK